MTNGSFVISLDFELIWGVRDKLNVTEYRNNILGARSAIPKIIQLFEKYNVNATFATVGLLFCESKSEVEKYSPVIKPSYTNSILSPYENNYIVQIKDNQDPYHSASEIIELLYKSNNIEIGSHTFSHYYCWESGQTIDQFEADIIAAVKIAKDKNIELRSIVFPRNQVPDNYLKICTKYNIDTYRGNPELYYSRNGGLFSKILRFADSYIVLDKSTCYKYSDVFAGEMFNVKASRFLRPYSSKFSLLDKLKLRRIKNEMTYAAKNQLIYHLWWHPHNFGVDQSENFSMLEEILQHYSFLNEKYAYQSYSMSEISELVTTKCL